MAQNDHTSFKLELGNGMVSCFSRESILEWGILKPMQQSSIGGPPVPSTKFAFYICRSFGAQPCSVIYDEVGQARAKLREFEAWWAPDLH